MGPEKAIQNKVRSELKKRGWEVFRIGFNGLPDLIAVHPSGEGVGWVRELHKGKGGFPINCRGYLPHDLTLLRDMPETKLCLELKVPGGRRSPRQSAYIRILEQFAKSAFICNVEDVVKLADEIVAVKNT